VNEYKVKRFVDSARELEIPVCVETVSGREFYGHPFRSDGDNCVIVVGEARSWAIPLPHVERVSYDFESDEGRAVLARFA